MAKQLRQTPSASYRNPLFSRDFPDPFVLKYRGEYWAYCTGFWDDGRCFGMLHSRDLVQWQPLGGAMAPLPEEHTCYWAPEVSYDNGRFYLYYSVGNEEQMQIRVALADHPAGPFLDSGQRLTAEPFAIDPHVFVDDSGDRFLFYATDFLEYERIGTGTVCDQMLGPFTLKGRPRPVSRPRFDWQIYDPHRIEKGGVRWHTIEGPFVLHHKGLYYQMFSGGNWRDPGYGVCYATTNDLARAGEWEQACDGATSLPILRTVPGQVIGPGHNSVVRGPDNRQLYCVYHRWEVNRTGRLLAIDPLEWAGERLLVLGPSQTPQPAPLLPTLADYFEQPGEGGLGEQWDCRSGRWSAGGGEAVQQAAGGPAEALFRARETAFLVEVSLRALTPPASDQIEDVAAYGVNLFGDEGAVLRFQIVPAQNEAIVFWHGATDWRRESWPLSPGFKAGAYHLLRLEVDGPHVRLALDAQFRWEGQILDSQAYQVALSTQDLPAAFSGFALTFGWEEGFLGEGSPAGRGWLGEQGPDHWRQENGRLLHLPAQDTGRLYKGPLLPAYELVVNACLGHGPGKGADSSAAYGFYPARSAGGSGPLLTVEREGAGFSLVWQEPARGTAFPLPPDFDPALMQQFRFRVEPGRLAVQWQDQPLGEGPLRPGPARVGLYARGQVAFDLVRVTALNQPATYQE
jgi:GH43 family beta-xylosidase